MTGLWIALGLFALAAYGFLMFHLGVRASWGDYQERLKMIRSALQERDHVQG